MEALSSWFTYVSANIDYIWESTLAHARISLIAVALATVFSITLGVIVQRRPLARTIVLTAAGILLTIPSLALFALFIPVFGIGNTPAIAALYLYAILPILRNTVTGLDSVSPAVVESARGMGLSTWQQLVKVRLPLAWPVIMTGIRVATLLTVGITAIAVLVGGDGLGTYVQSALTRNGLPNATEQLYVGVVFTVALGLVLDLVLAVVQRFTTAKGLRL
ncbi:ABC transporter permease [Nocardioides bruguierae]|uniref:ABC transporter permease n=1 Tax=Nocardioides bruguierae TaxID=2945102 RepID=A0A9X2IEZ7_9ACTN|nr:ABC transporter permease [Nocardioides bruguierae]MCL8024151.1 ABC transporter permease [Nocardioides bruguierae]MCM0619854.1 ABC transporter permease [Nocardioides bruguierae]